MISLDRLSEYVKSKKWYKWTYFQNKTGFKDIENEIMVT